MSELSDKSLQIAIGQLGQQEKPLGSNWGEPVKSYLKSVGIGFPASWCMAFGYWCFREAAVQLSVPNPLVKTGGVLAAWNKADRKYRVTVPEAGDIFIMDFGKGLGHTGIVERVDGNHIHTIEGNSNDTGSREGIEVVRKIRSISKIKGFLRY